MTPAPTRRTPAGQAYHDLRNLRDEADYTGVRVTLTAQLASARIPLHVNVNFGDPIWPEPSNAALPLLLGGTLQVRGYPDHMVLAEKIVTAVDRGSANTRWRDFVDIAAIIGRAAFGKPTWQALSVWLPTTARSR